MSDLYLKLNLSFFDDSDKTEEATPKKKEKAREEGQVVKSVEIGTAFLFLSSFVALKALGPYIYNSLLSVFEDSFEMLPTNAEAFYQYDYITKYINNMFGKAIMIALPIMLIIMVVGLVVNIIQVGWKITTKPLKPNFKRLNPLSGFKRMFSMRAILDLFKSLFKIFIIGYVIYSIVKKELNVLPVLIELDLFEAMIYIADVALNMGITVGGYFLAIGAVDYFYNWFKHRKDLRMTKQEVKDEYKNTEGDPLIKGKIKSKMREMSMKRMMQSVPGADVIITNPTHFACALSYDKQEGGAPVLVAKGADFLAKRIKEIATEHNIQIVENKQLARALYNTVNVGSEIPPELYQAVAEILAYVYKLKNLA